jgi:hypothetical protein
MDGAYPEPWIERLIREASEDGEFDDVPGHGKPIPHLDRRFEPSWWARTWVAREARSEAATELAARIRRTVSTGTRRHRPGGNTGGVGRPQ